MYENKLVQIKDDLFFFDEKEKKHLVKKLDFGFSLKNLSLVFDIYTVSFDKENKIKRFTFELQKEATINSCKRNLKNKFSTLNFSKYFDCY